MITVLNVIRRSTGTTVVVVRYRNWDRRSSQLARNSRQIKIGISGWPEARWDDYGREYNEMIVLYKTTSKNYIRDLEWQLVEEYGQVVDNEAPGGSGGVKGPPYYLYVVRWRSSPLLDLFG